MRTQGILCQLVLASAALGGELPEPGTHGHYLVLTGKTNAPPPLQVVDVVYGPRETRDGRTLLWWQLSARTEEAREGVQSAPLFRLRALTAADPLGSN